MIEKYTQPFSSPLDDAIFGDESHTTSRRHGCGSEYGGSDVTVRPATRVERHMDARFFGQRSVFSVIVIITLWIAMVATIVAFTRINRKAALLLLVPYLLWVSFATYLNVSI